MSYHYYDAARKGQSSTTNTSGAIAALVLFAALSVNPATASRQHTHTPSTGINSAKIVHAQAEKDIIARLEALATDPSFAEEGETPPTAAVIAEAVRLIRDASIAMGGWIIPAQVSAFHGEINVSWRSGDLVVRLACFPNGPSVVQTGQISVSGSYRSEKNPDGRLLADRLESLLLDYDPEVLISG